MQKGYSDEWIIEDMHKAVEIVELPHKSPAEHNLILCLHVSNHTVTSILCVCVPECATLLF